MQGLRQELRISQELQLQPQQILRSELVQLPILELSMRVREELVENPFLEETLDPDEEKTGEESKAGEDDSENENGAEKAKEELEEKNREIDWEDFLNDSDHWEYRPKSPNSNEERIDIPQPDSLTLSDHLHEQLYLDTLSEDEIRIGEEIIGNINHNGYLEIDLEEIAETLNLSLEQITNVHSKIIEYDPVGIGSRNLQQCLLVQLKHLHENYPTTISMLDLFWKDFINKRFEILAEKLDVTLDEIKESFLIISKLNPKPGEGWFNEKQNYIIPDLVVVQVDDDFEVYLNDGDIPNFRINPTYRNLYLNKKGTEKKVKDYLSRKFESARWFINAIHQRRTTMIRTMRAIVDKQRAFFESGQAHLKPMILADIADIIEMDISTISRVTNGKYVQTDWGVFELKYFFSEKMTTSTGTDVSNRVIKQRLSDIIGSENKQKPFSDQELTIILNKEGFFIKRRTVAKYREQHRIPVKRLRREI